MNINQEAFVQAIKPGALSAREQFGILPSLTIAQAILETGWGAATIGNNVFGIKAGDEWEGLVQEVPTQEYDCASMKFVNTTAIFRDYATIEESIVDHAKVLSLPRYAPVIAAKEYREACKQVQACGYATDPDYAAKLINLIEMYDLAKWDNVGQVKTESEIVAEAIDYLAERGRINSPDMWKTVVGTGVINYLEIIFVKWANDLRERG